MQFNQSITKIIKQRYSCRTYLKKNIANELRQKLDEFAASSQEGPLGSHCRFKLIAAEEGDSKALRGLGTYGFIKNAPGYIVGATQNGKKSLEDFGYLMEKIILYATDLGLGTCWLGGTFTRSRFARKISAIKDETIPSVASVGYIAARPRKFDQFIRKEANADSRRPWEWLFFEEGFDNHLNQQAAREFALPLEMVRLGPSASNLQPWRIIKCGKNFHFYLKRKLGYHDSSAAKVLKTADLQRVDMGIAMCHFETTALEIGLAGQWKMDDPNLDIPDALTEYSFSWVS